MHMELDPNFALLNASGRGKVKRLILTDAEKKTLKAAQDICRKSSEALGEDDDGEFYAAEWRLDVVNK